MNGPWPALVRPRRGLRIDDDQGVTDGDAAFVQVDVGRTQAAAAARAYSQRGQQKRGWVQLILTDRREEGSDLLGCPGAHSTRRARGGRA